MPIVDRFLARTKLKSMVEGLVSLQSTLIPCIVGQRFDDNERIIGTL